MKKVIVFGTFDGIHKGHLSFFRQAKNKGDFLLVCVARDKNVFTFKKKMPKKSEKQRVLEIRKIASVNKAILGSTTNNYFRTLRTYKPNILALGYDQSPSIPKLKKELRKHRIKNVSLIRLRPFKPQFYKSSILSHHV